jgi:predicted nucleic acid-binding protein
LDAGALIAIERADPWVEGLIRRAMRTGDIVTVPAGALAQVVRAPGRQARLARLLRQPTTDVVPLDRADALAVGRLLARSRTSDVVDAHVAVCARRAGQPIVTSDPDDLRRLDPDAELVEI